jgi:thiol-disulfide isomerase/thioredoxin
MKRLRVFLLQAVLGCAACLGAAAAAAPPPMTVDLSAFKGRVVYLDFWASWCEPCRKSIPWMQTLRNSYERDGLTVLAIDVDSDRADGDRFLRRFHPNSRCAAERYRESFGMEAPTGLRTVRVHDLRHTFGRRLRAAGVSLEDRRDLLGHKGPDITTHYSAPEIGRLAAAANRIVGFRESSTPTLRGMAERDRKSLVEREGIEPSTPAL